MTTKKLCIQCMDAVSGQTGSFLAEPEVGRNIAFSPIFDGLVALFGWCRKNGWEESYHPEFPVGVYKFTGDLNICLLTEKLL